MSTFATLIRGTATPKDLADELDRLGVEPGMEFVLTTPALLRPEHGQSGGARRDDKATAKAAAEAVRPKTGTQKDLILSALIDIAPQGMTAAKLIEATGIEYRSITPRIGALLGDGYLKVIGTAPGDRGVDTQIVAISDKTLAAYGQGTLRARLDEQEPEVVDAEPVPETESFLPSDRKPHNALTYDGD